MNNISDIERVHKLELLIAKEIRKICDSNGIKYFITAGTLLGAVRHGGFIPWDDDMDIGMLREDYEKFLKACKNSLDDKFFLQTWDTDENYPYSFGKLRLKGTKFEEDFSGYEGDNNGFFVDIFPFDNVPDNPIKRTIQKWTCYFCKRLLWIKKGYGKTMLKQSKKQSIKYSFFYMVSKLFSYNSIKNYYKKILVKYNKQYTEKIVTDGSYSYEKESIKRAWTEKLTSVVFEGTEFLTYKDPIVYLKYFYGDYAKLPPIEKRIGHLPQNIDFGVYK